MNTNAALREAHGFATDTTYSVVVTDYVGGQFHFAFNNGSKRDAWEAAKREVANHDRNWTIEVLKNEGGDSFAVWEAQGSGE